MPALTWTEDFYALERAVGHALCVAHKGAHVWHAHACQVVPKGLSRYQRSRLRRELSPEPEPVGRVEIDANQLAAGIAMALDGLMERRRQARTGRGEPALPAPADGASILERYSE